MIRPARPDDFRALLGADCAYPWAGVAAEHDGKVVGLGYICWAEGRAYCFVNCPQEWMPRPITAQRLAKRVMRAAFEAGETELWVHPTPGVPTAKKWLSSLGFKFKEMHNDKELWSCRA